MEIEVINLRRVSHLTADKIRIRDGSKTITVDLSPDGVFISTADAQDSQKTLFVQPVHSNKLKII